MIPQGVLPFNYEVEKRPSGMTALAGLPTYLDLAFAARLSESIDRHVRVREEGQGWSDRQVVMALVMLNLAGGSCVEDLEVLEADRGFVQVLRRVETHGMKRHKRRELERRWRKERTRGVPSSSSVFRYLERFHEVSWEKQREPHRAFIPAPGEGLVGLGKVNAELMGFVQKHSPQSVATLDMDATLVQTSKKEALYCYEHFKAYQPLSVYWAEQDLVVQSEFRDGNVPAGYQQLRVLKEALSRLPEGVEAVRVRADTAGYEWEFLKYCAERRDEPLGVIEFAVGVDVTEEFKKAVAQVPAREWHPLYREVKGKRVPTRQEWAEVCFVPNQVGYSKKGPQYRFLAIREPLVQLEFPGMPVQQTFPFPTMDFPQVGQHKVFGVVTNRTIPGDELIWWHRERCGKGEEVHKVMKEDLAGGTVPSGKFGVNAAWWAILVLAFNLNSAMKRLALGGKWVSQRLKAIRFWLIHLPGLVVEHARRLVIRLSGGHLSTALLLAARRKIFCLAQEAPG
jgi:hypothetical protein